MPDDGEASEESYGASNETQLGLRLNLLVSLYVIKGGCVKIDLDQLESWFVKLSAWKLILQQWKQSFPAWVMAW